MNYIDTTLPHIIEAKEKHYKELKILIVKRIEEKTSGQIKTLFDDHIIPHLETIIKGTPEELFCFHTNLNAENLNIEDEVKDIFDYSYFIRKKKTIYDAYDLAQKLNIPTCPYCNRMYTKTVTKNSKITRPTFDHWFPKSDFPILALSFHNLIPSCNVCNSSVKGTGLFDLDTHFHPYSTTQRENNRLDFKFSYEHKDYSTFKFKIKNNNNFSKNSTEAFKLKEIYETHEDEIADLRRLRDVYSDRYLKMLKKNILTTSSNEEIYRLAFGTYLDEAKFDRRPLSKMKKDILEELGILKHLKK